ncbi:MAG: hypothetical protein QOE51_3599 [Actinoplanes sp.]|jgi:hypothetical protein|nr:hypothetical protein [Actinoplanes sp.]
MERDLDEMAQAVENYDDFARFVAALTEDLERDPRSWENRTLDAFLDALGRFSGSIESWARNNNVSLGERPTWSLIAEMMLIAKEYE